MHESRLDGFQNQFIFIFINQYESYAFQDEFFSVEAFEVSFCLYHDGVFECVSSIPIISAFQNKSVWLSSKCFPRGYVFTYNSHVQILLCAQYRPESKIESGKCPSHMRHYCLAGYQLNCLRLYDQTSQVRVVYCNFALSSSSQ